MCESLKRAFINEEFATISAGLSAAATTRISNLLGEGQGHRARDSTVICLAITLITDGVFAVGLVAAGPHWARAFTTDESIVQVTGRECLSGREGQSL